MTDSLQYQCIIKNGQVEKEEGYFFRAAPFQIICNETVIDIKYERNESYHVIYSIQVDSKEIFQLEHPDYTPECKPANLNEELKLPNGIDSIVVIAALKHLGVSKGKEYMEYFTEAVLSSLSYEIKQETFLLK